MPIRPITRINDRLKIRFVVYIIYIGGLLCCFLSFSALKVSNTLAKKVFDYLNEAFTNQVYKEYITKIIKYLIILLCLVLCLYDFSDVTSDYFQYFTITETVKGPVTNFSSIPA